MKKLISLLALLLCLCVLTACGAQNVLSDVARQLHEANEAGDAGESAEAPEPAQADEVREAPVEDASESDADAPRLDGGDAAQDASPADAGTDGAPQFDLPEETAHPDFAALSLAECVTDADGAAGQLPRITLDCAGADYINDDIEGTFRYLIGEDYCRLSYECYKNGGVLSILIIESYDGDFTSYTPYNLDLITGSSMSGSELAALLGVDTGTLADAETKLMDEEFQHMYGGGVPDEMDAFLREQHDRTVDVSNADTERLWLDGFGRLFFVARIYSLAGAEYYEYPMDTGYTFS